jgi:hypothetical protein
MNGANLTRERKHAHRAAGLPRRSPNCRSFRAVLRHSRSAYEEVIVIADAAYGERDRAPAAPGPVSAPAARFREPAAPDFVNAPAVRFREPACAGFRERACGAVPQAPAAGQK